MSESEKLQHGKLYPLADGLTTRPGIKAVYTGGKRPPKKGEWYLSGTIIEAYQAKNNMTTPYHIARLVKAVLKPAQWIEVE